MMSKKSPLIRAALRTITGALAAAFFVSLTIFTVMGFGAGLVWLFHGGSFPHWHVGLVGYALFGVFFVVPLLFLILLLVSVLVSGFLDHLEEIRQEDSDSYP
jgi:uncharacterized membrane protein